MICKNKTTNTETNTNIWTNIYNQLSNQWWCQAELSVQLKLSLLWIFKNFENFENFENFDDKAELSVQLTISALDTSNFQADTGSD